MFGDTIVAVDESGGGRDAIALALRLIVSDGKLTLVHVLTTPPWAQLSPGPASEAAERRGPSSRVSADELLRHARDETGIALRRATIAMKCVTSSSVGAV